MTEQTDKKYIISEGDCGNSKNDLILSLQLAFIKYWEDNGFPKGNPILHLQCHSLAEIAFKALLGGGGKWK